MDHQLTDVGFQMARIGVGALLLGAGLIKLASLGRFFQSISGVLVPKALAPVIGLLVPLTEVPLGGAMLLNYQAAASHAIAAGLFAAFALVTAASVARGGRGSSCGCVGRMSRLSPLLPVRNAGFALLAASVSARSPLLLWLGVGVLLVGFLSAFVVRETKKAPVQASAIG